MVSDGLTKFMKAPQLDELMACGKLKVEFTFIENHGCENDYASWVDPLGQT